MGGGGERLRNQGCNYFCLQFEASCLQLSFSAYNCVWELFSLLLELFYLQLELSYLQFKPLWLTMGICVWTPERTVSKRAQL